MAAWHGRTPAGNQGRALALEAVSEDRHLIVIHLQPTAAARARDLATCLSLHLSLHLSLSDHSLSAEPLHGQRASGAALVLPGGKRVAGVGAGVAVGVGPAGGSSSTTNSGRVREDDDAREGGTKTQLWRQLDTDCYCSLGGLAWVGLPARAGRLAGCSGRLRARLGQAHSARARAAGTIPHHSTHTIPLSARV